MAPSRANYRSPECLLNNHRDPFSSCLRLCNLRRCWDSPTASNQPFRALEGKCGAIREPLREILEILDSALQGELRTVVSENLTNKVVIGYHPLQCDRKVFAECVEALMKNPVAMIGEDLYQKSSVFCGPEPRIELVQFGCSHSDHGWREGEWRHSKSRKR